MTIFIEKADYVIRGDAEPLSAAQAYQRGLRLLDSMLPKWQREQLSAVTTAEPMKPLVDAWAASSDPALAAFGKALQTEGSYSYAAFANQWQADNTVNETNNLWNWQLHAYRAAKARLAQYEKSKGRAAVTQQKPEMDASGLPVLDKSGNPVMQTVTILPAIDPLPAMIAQPVYDATGKQTGTVDVPNPEIAQDEAERAAAQAVIDATPADVAAWTPPK